MDSGREQAIKAAKKSTEKFMRGINSTDPEIEQEHFETVMRFYGFDPASTESISAFVTPQNHH